MRSTSRQVWQREQRDDFTIREVLYVLWGRKVLVISFVLILVLVALAFSLFREKVYKAEAIVSIEHRSGLGSGQDAEIFANEVLRRVNSEELRTRAMRRADWQKGSGQFDQQISLQPFGRRDSEESGLSVSFAAPEAAVAARSANAYSTLFAERVNQLNERLAGGSLAAEASVQSRAVRPEHPSSPRPLLYSLLAAGAGLLAGGFSALVLESRARSWRGARDAEMTLRAPVLGVIPEYSPENGDV